MANRNKNALTVSEFFNTFKENPQEENNGWEERQLASSIIRKKLGEERLRELNLKHWSRIYISIFTALLLVGQNLVVFSIVIRSLNDGSLKDLQLIFAALVSATLTETYFIMKIIVNFVFSPSDYNYEKK